MTLALYLPKMRTKNNDTPTMYKNNSRDSSVLEGFSPLELSCNLIGKCLVVGYYSYTKRCVQLQKEKKH